MGEVGVPARALYGAQTARAVQNFPISGLRAHPAFVDATLRVKLAAARVNASLGLLPRAKARAIERAAREVLAGARPRPVRGGRLPGRRRHLPPHERERGAGPPGQRAPGRPGAAGRRRFTPTTTSTWPSPPTTWSPPPSGWRRWSWRRGSWRRSPAWRPPSTGKAARLGRHRQGRAAPTSWTPRRHPARARRSSGWAAALGTAAGAGARRAAGALPARHRRHGRRHRPQRPPALPARDGRGARAASPGLPLQRRAQTSLYAMQSLAPFVALSGALRAAALELAAHRRRRPAPRQRPEPPASASSRLPAVQPGSSIMPGKVNPSMAEMLAMVCLPGHRRWTPRSPRPPAAGSSSST